MKTTKKENAKNDNINLQADALSELPLADEQADEIKGGTKATPKLMLHCAEGRH